MLQAYNKLIKRTRLLYIVLLVSVGQFIFDPKLHVAGLVTTSYLSLVWEVVLVSFIAVIWMLNCQCGLLPLSLMHSVSGKNCLLYS